MTVPPEYFDDLYAATEDPWGFRDRWYERRKRDITAASLPQRRYRRGFEAGCSIGLVSALLAERCDHLLSVDASGASVTAAAREVAGLPNVRVRRRILPEQWPVDEQFDLIVLSEVGYYFDADDLAVVLARTVGSLASDGVLLACHWRHPVADYPQSGDAVHRTIREQPGLVRTVLHDETDFLLEVFTLGHQPSVAQREGLVP